MKKKISALLLSLALCAGLLAGCGAGETAEAPSDTDVQQVDSLKIAFSPYADADLISESTEPLEELLKAKLLELRERAKEEEMANIKGEMKKIEWGSQIRSYVFQPYTMVKDHRTNYESGNIDDVMDGNLEGFITAYLKMQ